MCRVIHITRPDPVYLRLACGRATDLLKGGDLPGPLPGGDLAVGARNVDRVQNAVVVLGEVLGAKLRDESMGGIVHPLSIDGGPDLRRRLLGRASNRRDRS